MKNQTQKKIGKSSLHFKKHNLIGNKFQAFLASFSQLIFGAFNSFFKKKYSKEILYSSIVYSKEYAVANHKGFLYTQQ